jgi:LacI family transcriptional regulator
VDESVTLSATTWKDLDEGFVPPPILRNQVDGIIVRGRLNPRLLTWLKSLGLAVVLLDCDDIYPEFSQVRIDHIQGVEAIVQRLDQVGCQKIAVLAGDRQHLNTIERVSALQAALVRRGRWLSQDATFFGDFGGPKAECACRELLDSGYSFDAIVCQSDPIALVALKELTSRGIRVPEDVKLIGFDDFPEASSVSPSLTTVSVPVEELAEIATDLLYDEIRSREAKRRHILCSCELVIRDSC